MPTGSWIPIVIALVWWIIQLIANQDQKKAERKRREAAEAQQRASAGGRPASAGETSAGSIDAAEAQRRRRAAASSYSGGRDPGDRSSDRGSGVSREELSARRQAQLEELRRRRDAMQGGATARTGGQTPIRTSGTASRTVSGGPVTVPGRSSTGPPPQRQVSRRTGSPQGRSSTPRPATPAVEQPIRSSIEAPATIDEAVTSVKATEIGTGRARRRSAGGAPEMGAYGAMAHLDRTDLLRSIRAKSANRATMREAIVWQQILDRPVGLRP